MIINDAWHRIDGKSNYHTDTAHTHTQPNQTNQPFDLEFSWKNKINNFAQLINYYFVSNKSLDKISI